MSSSRLSPLLLSSLEMMQHAIEHLKNGTPKSMGFGVLHADDSIELILKEIVRSRGIRLINKKGYSMDYYECIDQLIQNGIIIPELPSIDLLHTERNNTYHLGNKPDKDKSEWLVYDVALTFLRRICRDELNYNIDSFSKDFKLSEETKQDVEMTRSGVVNGYLIKAVAALNSSLYDHAVMASYIGIEALMREYYSTKTTGVSRPRVYLRTMMKDILSRGLFDAFQELNNLRNKVAHGMIGSTEKDARFALEVFRRVIDEIGVPLELKCKTCGLQFNSGIVMNRKSFETTILNNKHQCPRGHVHSYDKEDYILMV